MTRKGLLVVLAVLGGLCAGQGCPGPEPQGSSSTIPEGVYAGQITFTSILYLNGKVVDATEQTISATPHIFGSDGLPLTKDSEPVFIGYSETSEFSNMEITGTITSIRSVQNGLAISYDVVVVPTVEGTTYELTGTMQETHKLNGDGTLSFTGSLSVGATVGTDAISQTITSTGTLLP